MEQKQMHT